MQELYFPEAVVLDREDSNDIDSRFSIYAKGYGKFYAKAKSARKILSKLSGHLEPGSLVKIRLVGNGAWQVTDVLKSSRVEVRCSDLYLLNQLLPEADFDFALWEVLTESSSSSLRSSGREPFDWKKVLKVLGWDPEHARCEICKSADVSRFVISGQSFLCDRCALNTSSLLVEL